VSLRREFVNCLMAPSLLIDVLNRVPVMLPRESPIKTVASLCATVMELARKNCEDFVQKQCKPLWPMRLRAVLGL
jgi:hypothetical protein